MLELDHVWSKMIDEAAFKASNAGRQDIVDYLRLRATNDAIRKAGVSWLFDTVIEIASEASRHRRGIIIEREEPHNFARGNSNMVGSLLEIRQGVRCLSVEAGWARTPSDGIMLKGSLAFARFSHFGMPKFTAEIRLIHGDDLPKWLHDDGSTVETSAISGHLEIFLGS
ncbi:MAG: hypothetical protein QM785_06485 [Pyrinomonadaceae bacterium]